MDKRDRQTRVESLYLHALARYERRLDFYEYCGKVLMDPTSTPAVLIVAESYRNQYRPLVRQAINLAAALEEEMNGNLQAS